MTPFDGPRLRSAASFNPRRYLESVAARTGRGSARLRARNGAAIDDAVTGVRTGGRSQRAWKQDSDRTGQHLDSTTRRLLEESPPARSGDSPACETL